MIIFQYYHTIHTHVTLLAISQKEIKRSAELINTLFSALGVDMRPVGLVSFIRILNFDIDYSV